jgi:BASS family bile acid:Na+ symporter
VALGMILVASCPGGNISNFVSSLAKGNIALSVSLTAISSIGAIVLTPLNFSIYGNLYLHFLEVKSSLARPIEIDPYQMFQTVFIILGIPLILGILTNKKFPKFTEKIIKPIKILSILVFAGFVVVAFRNNFDYFSRYIHYIFLIVLIHNFIALLSGYGFARLFNMNRQNRRTIAIETGIQNSGLALALIFNPKIFPVELEVGGMAFVAAWWGIWHIISGLGLAFWWHKRPTE